MAISPDMFKGHMMCDKTNQGFAPRLPLLLSSKPFGPRFVVTELIECAFSTTMELSFRILAPTSTFSSPNISSADILFKRRSVSKHRRAACISLSYLEVPTVKLPHDLNLLAHPVVTLSYSPIRFSRIKPHIPKWALPPLSLRCPHPRNVHRSPFQPRPIQR